MPINEPSDVERMPDVFVEDWGGEIQRRVFATAQMQPHLAQAEEVEVIDEVGAGK